MTFEGASGTSFLLDLSVGFDPCIRQEVVVVDLAPHLRDVPVAAEEGVVPVEIPLLAAAALELALDGLEQVVRHVAVGDVVVQVVNAHAVLAIHRLEGALDEGPRAVVVHHRLRVVVLQVGHREEPPAEDDPRPEVDQANAPGVVLEGTHHAVRHGRAGGRRDEGLGTHHEASPFPQRPGERREVPPFCEQDVEEPPDEREQVPHRLEHPGVEVGLALPVVRVVPRMRHVLHRSRVASVVVVGVVHVVRARPRPVRHQDARVGDVPAEVVHPGVAAKEEEEEGDAWRHVSSARLPKFAADASVLAVKHVLGEAAVAAVMPDHEDAPHDEALHEPVDSTSRQFLGVLPRLRRASRFALATVRALRVQGSVAPTLATRDASCHVCDWISWANAYISAAAVPMSRSRYRPLYSRLLLKQCYRGAKAANGGVSVLPGGAELEARAEPYLWDGFAQLGRTGQVIRPRLGAVAPFRRRLSRVLGLLAEAHAVGVHGLRASGNAVARLRG
eukprot:scaffold834_cov244-Pinguiococcus_pyrenoidosus.AAC.7